MGSDRMNDIEFKILSDLANGIPLSLASMTREERASVDFLAVNGLVDAWIGGDLEITDQGLLALQSEKEQRQRSDEANKRERKDRARKSIKDVLSFVFGILDKIFPFFFN